MEFRTGTGVSHKMLWNFYLAQVSCMSDLKKSQKVFPGPPSLSQRDVRDKNELGVHRGRHTTDGGQGGNL